VIASLQGDRFAASRRTSQQGLFDSLLVQLESEIASNYFAQAEDLLNERVAGAHDYAPAAVLLGAIFENAARALCSRQTPPIDTKTPKGEPKKLNVLIDEMKAAGVYNELKAKELRWAANVRNHAAHGEFDRFTRADVDRMQEVVRSFLADQM
jgi:hypothetical protein